MSWNEDKPLPPPRPKKETPLEDMVLISREERDSFRRRRNDIHTRVRKLEKILLRWLELEDNLDNAKTDRQIALAEHAIHVHRAVVRRALFR